MPKLVVKQNNIEYYGFFTEPAFDLMGDVRSLIKMLYNAFSRYEVSLANFRLEGDVAELSTTAAMVRLGMRGIYRFKFDQIQASLNTFTNEQLAGFVEALQVGDEHLRTSVPNLAFKTHAFFYTGHGELSDGKASDFLMRLPPRDISVPGEDLGSGLIQSWRDPNMGANVSLTVDHSLAVTGGVFINYRVILERDQVDYIPLSVIAQQTLYAQLTNIGLEIEE